MSGGFFLLSATRGTRSLPALILTLQLPPLVVSDLALQAGMSRVSLCSPADDMYLSPRHSPEQGTLFPCSCIWQKRSLTLSQS